MARIRTIKPEFFSHEELYDLEAETGLPVRLAFIALWTQADRDGRFKWRPRTLKAACLPFDDVDFSRVLDALATRGFVVRYGDSDSQSGDYGYIPTWNKHQAINGKERSSELPDPQGLPTREPRVNHALPELEGNSLEGKGKERKGKEQEGEDARVADATPPPRFDPKKADLPKPLNTPAFQAAWLDWCHHRTEIRKPLRPTSVQQQLRELADWGHDRAVAALRHTIAKGWQGIREPETRGSPVSAGQRDMAEILRKIEENNR